MNNLDIYIIWRDHLLEIAENQITTPVSFSDVVSIPQNVMRELNAPIKYSIQAIHAGTRL